LTVFYGVCSLVKMTNYTLFGSWELLGALGAGPGALNFCAQASGTVEVGALPCTRNERAMHNC